jgi:hypothetical protein
MKSGIKIFVKSVILLVLIAGSLSVASWLTACKKASADEVQMAKRAIEHSGCVQSIYLFRLYEDNTYKEFGYTVETKSGSKINLWFDTSKMKMNQVCNEPQGIVVNMGGRDEQIYTIESLNEGLKEKNIKIADLKDFLYNCSELLQLFQKNHDYPQPKVHGGTLQNYLQIYFPFEERPSVD